jgi:hypothetical protein
LSEVYLDEGANASVSAVFRCFKVPLRAIKETWPDAKIPEEWQQTLNEKPEKP